MADMPIPSNSTMRKVEIGSRFGRLEIVGKPDPKPHGSKFYSNATHWIGLCDCGIRKVFFSKDLIKSKENLSCGCFGSKRNSKTLVKIGEKYKKLTVVSETFMKGGTRMVDCVCECGNNRTCSCSELVSGDRATCGKCQRTMTQEFIDNIRSVNTKHGMARKTEYRTWKGMISRCFNPKDHAYSDYGGRGITICDRWLDVEVFFNDMGERPRDDYSIDRIDVNGNYCPENCRWADKFEQSRNRRISVFYPYNGEMLIKAEIARLTGLTPGYVANRLDKDGWTVNELMARSRKAVAHLSKKV